MINKAIIYLTPLRSGEEIQEEEREEESYIVCYIGHIRIRTFLNSEESELKKFTERIIF
jgi:hypothetical protein